MKLHRSLGFANLKGYSTHYPMGRSEAIFDAFSDENMMKLAAWHEAVSMHRTPYISSFKQPPNVRWPTSAASRFPLLAVSDVNLFGGFSVSFLEMG